MSFPQKYTFAYLQVASKNWKWFLGALGLSYSGLIPPRGAGFYCDDQSIKHTYKGDTISVVNLFLGSLLLPIFFILPIELYEKWRKFRHTDVRSYLLSSWENSWKVWQSLLLGELLVLILTEFPKSVISEPRPHFWDTCKPNVTKEICDAGYVMDYSCTSDFTARQILDAQKSFPSGHTSVSVLAAVFMVWYLGRVVEWSHSYLLLPLLQLSWVCFAFYCGLTRITDRRHHWWDVLAGAIVGLGVAFVLIQAVGPILRRKKNSEGTDSTASTSMKEDGSNPHNLLRANPLNSNSNSKRPSVRRLLSTSSVASISEDPELNIVTSF